MRFITVIYFGFLSCMVFSGSVVADNYILGVNAKKITIFDDDFEEKGVLKKRDLIKQFKDMGESGKKGLKIIAENKDEGMLKINIKQGSVWVEDIFVEVSNKEEMKYSGVVVGAGAKSQRAVATGFGGKDKKKDSGKEEK